MTPQLPPRRTLGIVIGVLAVLSGVATGFGLSPWPEILIAMIAGILALAPRWGYLFAGAFLSLVVLLGALGVLILTALLPFGVLPLFAVVFGLLAVGFGLVIARTPGVVLRRGRATWMDLGGALVGPVIWAIALLVSFRVPTSERLSWLMRNDSMNNLILSHQIISEHGVRLGLNVNPVPLPVGLLAIGMIPGRPGGGAEAALAHDLAAMGWTWAALIGFFSLLAGLTAGTIVRIATRASIWSALAGAGGSVLVLSWYLTGYPIEFGFFNLDVALPVVLAAFLLTALARRSPWAAFVGLAIASTLILATWSPMVVVPLALLGLSLVRYRRQLWPSRTLPRLAVVLAAFQFCFYAAFGALPAFLSQGSLLGNGGGVYVQSAVIVFAVGAGVALLAVVLFRRDPWTLALPVAVVVSSWISVGALVFLNRNNANVWSYYPIKLAYFATVIFMILSVGLLAALVARYANRALVRYAGSAVIALALAVAVWFHPAGAPGISLLNPVVRVTTSHPTETAVAESGLILAIARTGTPGVVWNTGLAYEPQVNLWLIQLQDDTLSLTSKLRHAGYAQDRLTRSIGQLCTITQVAGPDLVIYTSDPALRAKLTKACPGSEARFAPVPNGRVG